MTSRTDVYEAIDSERDYQDAKWGKICARPHSVGEWLLIMEAELNEAKLAWAKNTTDIPALEEIRQVAAVAVACMENHIAIERAKVYS